MATLEMSLKLLIDKEGQRVLFAEASKDFVDFLFHIFSLPLGTLIELLGSKQMVGCLGKLKESIGSFNETYLQPGIRKDDIFNPKTVFNTKAFLLAYDEPAIDQSAASKTIYLCSNAFSSSGYGGASPFGGGSGYGGASVFGVGASPFGGGSGYGGSSGCRSYATLYGNSICPKCNRTMNAKMISVMPTEVHKAASEPVAAKKYVKELVTYMVMDDLVVKPMSTISSITLINKFAVKDISLLEEKTVSFGNDEGLKLLKASLTTDKVLTTLFLG